MLQYSSLDCPLLSGCKNGLTTVQFGSLYYVAPEIMYNTPYNGKLADLWTLGIILATFMDMYPFYMRHSNDYACLIFNIRNQVVQFPKKNAKLFCLLHSLLRRTPSQRMKTDDIFQHPWMISPLALQERLDLKKYDNDELYFDF